MNALNKGDQDTIWVENNKPFCSPRFFSRCRISCKQSVGLILLIDENARGDPRKDFYGRPEDQFDSSGGLRKKSTGAYYKIPAKDPLPNASQFNAELQVFQPPPKLTPMTWYKFEIAVQGNTLTVDLTNLETGVKTRTTTFKNTDVDRVVAMEYRKSVG